MTTTHPAQLTFVELETIGDGEQRVANYWRPATGGSYADHCYEGRRRAAELCDYISVTGALPVLTWVVGAMPRGPDMGAVEVGFLTGLGELAAGVA